MLQHIRKYADNILFKLLLGLIIISFIIAGISGVLSSSNKDYVAVVDGNQYISVTDFIDAKKRQLQQLRSIYSNITSEQIKGLDLDNTVLSQLVTAKLLEIETANLGILIDDSIVLNVIKSNQNFQDNSGNFDKELFKSILSRSKIPEADYVAQIKNDLANKALLNTLAVQINPSAKLVNAVNSYNNQMLNLQLIAVSSKNITNSPPKEEEIVGFYQKNVTQYTIPEYRDIEYLTFSQEQYQNKVNVSDEELQEDLNQYLNQSSSNKLFDYYDVIFDSEESAKEALSMLKEKKNWKSVVKKVTGEDAKEFLITKQNANDIPEETRELLKNLKKDENSNILKSDLGYHIIKLVKSENVEINLPELKKEIKQRIIDQKIEQAMFDDVKNVEDELSSGKTIEEVSKQYKLSVNSIKMIDKQGQNQQGKKHQQIPDFTNFVVEAFKLPQGQPSELFPIGETKPGYYILSTSKIYPEKQMPLEKVKADVINALSAENKMANAKKIANELVTKLGTADFDIAIKNYKSIVNIVTIDLPRPNESQNRDSIIPFENQIELFELKPGGVSKVFQTSNGDFAFAKINAIKNNGKLLSKEESENIKNGLSYNLSSSINQEYIRYLEKKYKVKIHSEVISQIGE
jgi:parvulin-like peptidyl-prolyl isomerase